MIQKTLAQKAGVFHGRFPDFLYVRSEFMYNEGVKGSKNLDLRGFCHFQPKTEGVPPQWKYRPLLSNARRSF